MGLCILMFHLVIRGNKYPWPQWPHQLTSLGVCRSIWFRRLWKWKKLKCVLLIHESIFAFKLLELGPCKRRTEPGDKVCGFCNSDQSNKSFYSVEVHIWSKAFYAYNSQLNYEDNPQTFDTLCSFHNVCIANNQDVGIWLNKWLNTLYFFSWNAFKAFHMSRMDTFGFSIFLDHFLFGLCFL